ncbi:MAG TPA: hypothetical protein ENJ54_03370 [Chloroflexi bacterium]|nr:hypothetical protein [Chloroflexota bacterium]
MKLRWKWLVPFVVVGLVLFLTGTALADGGPHGGYTPTTDACAGCHRAHTAQGANLLTSSTTYGLCMSCHGSAGTGADTNVEDGYFLSTRSSSTSGEANTTDNSPLLGGGFVNYKSASVTSAHNVNAGIRAAWGYGVARGSTADLPEDLSCASCHDPHGSSNYRIIKSNIAGHTVSVSQVDESAKDYDTEQWPADVSNVCVACHGAYHVTRANSGTNNADDGSGNTDYGGDVSTYAHRIDMAYNYGGNVNPETTGYGGYTLPLAGTDTVACQTCHLSHGTSATMSTLATASNTSDSALLRLDNRGVCEVCHQK